MSQPVSRRDLALGLALSATALPGQTPGQTNDPPGIGVIGLGNRSQAHFAALAKLPEARVVALCDIDSPHIEAVNSKLAQKAAPYTDYRELLRDKNVGIVVIATPNFMHREMAIAALRAGKDVLLEKPVATSYVDAREIQREAARSGRILGIGMQRVYRSDVELVETVRRGGIGDLKMITCGEYRRDWFPHGWIYKDATTGKSANWRFMKAAIGSSELEFSVHLFGTIARMVNSPLKQVCATGGSLHYSGRDIRDGSATIVEFANGVRLSHTYGMFAPQGAFLIALGSNGSLRRDSGKLQLFGADGKPKPPLGIERPAEEDEVLLYRDFFEAVRTRRQPKVGVDLAIEAAKIAYGLDTSITENRIVTDRDFA